MELNPINRIRLVSNSREFGVPCGADGVEALRQVTEFVTVRHPNSHIALNVLKQLINVASKPSSLQVGMTVFPGGACNDIVGVQAVGEFLEPVADTEDGDTEVKEGRVSVGCIILIDGVWAAGENDTLGLPSQISQLLGAGKHLGVDIDFAQTAGDEVGAGEVDISLSSLWFLGLPSQ